jgi:histone H3/H4
MGVELMADLLVVRSKIKECTECNVAGNFADALSKQVEGMIKDAERRAKGNGRKTVKDIDL